MITVTKCLKEWNATIEALGHGKQTILIRRYGTTADGFLLYPTVRYARKNNYLDTFQSKYKGFVEENTLPEKEDDKIAIKYYAAVEKIVEKSHSSIESLQKNYIWTSDHVKDYLEGKKAQVWVLRVYKLKKPYMDKPTSGAITYVNLSEEVSLEGMEPVLSDFEFINIDF